MRKLISIVPAVLVLLALVVYAQPPKGKGKGKGGFAPKNLQVLDASTFPGAMQSFVQALGLQDKGGCAFCHEDDRSSDAKMEKVMARNMLRMVREINARFPDGEQHVTCWTCHRGMEHPATAP